MVGLVIVMLVSVAVGWLAASRSVTLERAQSHAAVMSSR